MTIINLTPHPVNIVNDLGEVIRTYPKSEVPVRLNTKIVEGAPIDGIPTSKTTFGDPEGLPEEAVGTYYIVSQLVMSALPSRNDLIVPAQVVRDAEGNIIGCKSLGR